MDIGWSSIPDQLADGFWWPNECFQKLHPRSRFAKCLTSKTVVEKLTKHPFHRLTSLQDFRIFNILVGTSILWFKCAVQDCHEYLCYSRWPSCKPSSNRQSKLMVNVGFVSFHILSHRNSGAELLTVDRPIKEEGTLEADTLRWYQLEISLRLSDCRRKLNAKSFILSSTISSFLSIIDMICSSP